MAFITAETRSDLIALSVGMLKQAPSNALLEELIALSVSGGTLADAADHIAKTDAFKAEYPSFQTAQQYAAEIFDNITTGGTVTAEIRTAVIELATGFLTSGAYSKAGLALAIVDFLSQPAALLNDDFADIAQSVQNRSAAAEYFVVTKELGGSTAAELAAAIASVTSDAATLTAANTAADATASAEAVVAGQTFTLTTDAETVTGSAGDDRFVAVTIGEGGVGSTLLPGDVLDGGAGTDKLLLSTSGTYPNGDYTVAAIQASDIEIVHVNGFDVDTDNTIIDLTLMGTSIQEVGLASSNATGDVSFVNPKNFVDATMNNGSADLTVTYGSLALGSSDVQNLSLANVSAGTATFASVETINVTTSLANSKLTDLVISGANTLNISGDKKLTVVNDIDFKDFVSPTATGAEADGTIDASGAAGGVDLQFTSDDNIRFTGGAGDDTIRMVATGSKTFYDSIDGGDGDDTVTLQAAGPMSTKATSSAGANPYELLGFSNVETLSFTALADSSVDAEGLSADITTLATNSSGVTTLTVELADVTVTNTPVPGESGIDTIAAVTFTLNGVAYTTGALVSPSAAVGRTWTLSDGVTTSRFEEDVVADAVAALIDDITGLSTTLTLGLGAVDPTITLASTSTSRTEVVISELAGGADTDSVAGAVDGVSNTASNMAFTNLPDDGSVAVTVNSGANITLGLIDGSGEDDVINLNFAPTALDKGVTKTIDAVNITAAETLNINVSGMTDTVDTVLSAISADSALTTINVTGESDLTATASVSASYLTKLDASQATGDVKFAIPAHILSAGTTVMGGAGKDTFNFGAGLNARDIISGGDASDTVSGDVTGLTGAFAALGALNIADVETINLTNTTTTEIDAANITSASQISFTGAGTQATLSNLEAGTKLGLGTYDTAAAISGRVDVALADATGTEDVLGIVLNDTTVGSNTIELRASGIETVNFTFGREKSLINTANHVLDVDKLNASTITVSGSTFNTANTLNLQTLDTETTTVNAGTYSGVLTAAVAATGGATDFTVKAGDGTGIGVHNLTGSTKNDTFTVVGKQVNTALIIDGNGGTNDVLTMTLGAGALDTGGITQIDTMNLIVSGSSDVTSNTAGDLDGMDTAKSIVITGGNSLSSVILGGTTETLTGGTQTNVIDASGYAGSLSVFYAIGGFNDAVLGFTQQVIGTDATSDRVTASYLPSGTLVGINTQAVEKLDLSFTNSGTQQVIDMSKATGVNEIFITDASSELVKFSALASGVKLDVRASDNLGVAGALGTSVEVEMADATSSDDAITVELNPQATLDHTILTITDVETVTVESDTSANVASVSLAGVSMTALGATVAVNIGGLGATVITAGNADIASINASASVLGVTQQARANTGAVEYTGGAGNDTFIMTHSGDVINAAGGTSDKLDVNKNAILGGINIDLNAANQVVSFNGGSISGTVTGFEDVDLAGYTGSFGAQVSGLNTVGSTIIGTGNADEINGGTGVDTITGGAGADNLSGGAAADTFVYAAGVADTVAAATSVAGIDKITDLVVNGANADLIDLTVAVAAVNTAATGTVDEATFITDIDTLLGVGGGVGFDTVVVGDISAALVTANAGDQKGKTFLAVDINGDDAFTAADFIIDVTGITTTLLDVNVFV